MKKKQIIIVVVALILDVLIGVGICYKSPSTAPNGKEWTDAYSELQNDYDALKKEYSDYVSKMSKYEELSEKEAEARKFEAEQTIAKQKEQGEAEAEAAAKEQVEKEKKGYDTGITYSQLARTPDDYEGERVKFTGEVVQVMEGDGVTQIRLATKDGYDDVLLGEYDSKIVTSRVLEGDKITVYGVSYGLCSYETVMGDTMTIPQIAIEKVEQ